MAVRSKCRPRRPPPFSTSLDRVPPSASAVRKSLDDRFGFGHPLSAWRNRHVVFSVMPRPSSRSFFAQAAALSPLRSGGDAEPAQPALRQRSGSPRRPVSPGPAGLLLQPRPARRLRAHVFPVSGVGAAASLVHGPRLVAAAGGAAHPDQRPRRGAIRPPALCAGVGVSPAVPPAATVGRSAQLLVPPPKSARERANRSASAHRRASAKRLRPSALSGE